MLPPPQEGGMDGKQEEFHEGDRPERLTAPARPPTQSSSHSNLNVTPRPTPRPRHDGLQLQTLLPTAAPQFDNTVGRAGERDGADPAELDAHSEHFPLPLAQGGERRSGRRLPQPNLLALVARCGQRESAQDQPTASPTIPAGEGLITLVEQGGTLGSATHITSGLAV